MRKIILVLLVFIMFIPIQAHALERGGFTFELIRDASDLPSVILEHIENPVYYTPQEVTDFYLPLLYKKNTAGDLCLDRSDVAYYLKDKTNIESFEWVKGYYLKNVTYNELKPIYSCEDKDYGNYTQEECEITNYESVPKWILKWKIIPSSFCIQPNKWGAIYLHAHKNPTLESWKVDVVPVFKGIELPEYVWFSNDWVSRKQFNFTETAGYTRINEFVRRNFTGLTNKQADNDDLRVINDTDNSTIPIKVLSSTSDSAEIMFSGNWTASDTNTYYIYYNNPSANDPAYSTSDWIADDFNEASLDETIWNHTNTTGGGTTWYNETRGGTWWVDVSWTPTTDFTTIVGLTSRKTFGTTDTWCFDMRFNNTYTGAIGFNWLALSFVKSVGLVQYGITIVDDYIAYRGHGDALNNYFQTSTGINTTEDSGGNIFRLCHYDVSTNFVSISVDSGSTWSAWVNDTNMAGNIPYRMTVGHTGNVNNFGAEKHYVFWVDYMKPSTENNMTFTLGAEESQGDDWGDPTFYNNQSTSPSNYNPNVYSTANVTWNTTTQQYNYSQICHNVSGSWNCYETNRVNDNTSSYQIVSSATTFSWYMGANDTYDNWEYTLNYSESISQNSSMNCYQTFVESSPLNYGINLTARCSCSQPDGTVGMFRNSSNVTAQNNTGISLSAGYYDYVCNTTSSQNYTSETDTDSFTINKGTPTFYSWIGGVLNTNGTSFPQGTNITTNRTISTLTNECVVASCFNSYWIEKTGDWKTMEEWNGVNPNNYQWIAWNNTLTEGSYYFKDNTTETANYSSSYIIYGFEIGDILTINVLDELDNSEITFNITVENSSFSQTYYDQSLFNANSTNMAWGNITVIYWATGYPTRVSYIDNLTQDSEEDITLYLLSSTDGVYVTFFVYSNVNPTGYPDVLTTASRLMGGNLTQIDSRVSDDEGKGYLFLYPYTTHTVTAVDPNGITGTLENYYPSGSFILRLKIEDVGDAENVTWLYTNIQYSLSPLDIYIRNTSDNLTLINYTLTATESDLEYYGMNISLANGTVIYSNNTTSSTGGSISVNFNMTGRDGQTITVKTWFKKEGYDFWQWTRRYIVVRQYSYLEDALEALLPDGAIGLSELAGNLIALFLSLAGAGFGRGKMGGVGSSLLYMLLLAVFTFVGFFSWLIFLNLAFIGVIIIAGNRWF